MRRSCVLCVVLCLSLAGAAAADRPSGLLPPPEYQKSDLDSSRPLFLKQGGDTVWLQVYDWNDACPCGPPHGGECTGGPDERETFCFERYDPNTADSLFKYYGSPSLPFFSPSSGNGFSSSIWKYPSMLFWVRRGKTMWRS